MNEKIKNSISHNWNGLTENEINQLAEKIYNNDGDYVLNSSYNRWYFYKFSDNSYHVSRLTWDIGPTIILDNFKSLLNWMDLYYAE